MKDEVLERALDLPPEDREELVSKLQESLEVEEDDGEPVLSEEEWEEAWDSEILRRLDDLRSGRVKGVDAFEMLRQSRAELEEEIRKAKKKLRGSR